MSKKIRFKEEYIGLVRDVGMAWGKVTNRMIATRLRVDEKTIRSWRKEHHEFELAFINARALSQEKLNHKARNNLEVRKKKILKQSEDGDVVITEDVLPTHNDIAAYDKLSLRASEKVEERTLLRDIMKRKIAGELTALQAAQLLESEGIAVPKTLLLEVQKSIGIIDTEVVHPALIQFESYAGEKSNDDDNNSQD